MGSDISVRVGHDVIQQLDFVCFCDCMFVRLLFTPDLGACPCQGSGGVMEEAISASRQRPLTATKSESAVDDEKRRSVQAPEENSEIVKSKTIQSPCEKKGSPLVTPTTRLAATVLTPTTSYCDGHGFACNVSREPGPEGKSDDDPENGKSEEKQFEVKWDGPDDPMDPKNMSRARKWTIVVIVSSGSTCV